MRSGLSLAWWRRALVSAGVFAIALALAAPALASVADEQREGAALVRALTADKRDYDRLSEHDFERIGEYWMGRMLGSTRTHEAMNARMRQMIGGQGEERMHQLMGQRYASGCLARARRSDRGTSAACNWGPASNGAYDQGPMMGMMGDDYGWAPMMGMMRNWRQMSPDDWGQMMSQIGRTGAGRGTNDAGDSGWRTRDVALLAMAITLGILLLGSIALWRPWHRPRPTAP